jgi:hypothetical protein
MISCLRWFSGDHSIDLPFTMATKLALFSRGLLLNSSDGSANASPGWIISPEGRKAWDAIVLSDAKAAQVIINEAKQETNDEASAKPFCTYCSKDAIGKDKDGNTTCGDSYCTKVHVEKESTEALKKINAQIERAENEGTIPEEVVCVLALLTWLVGGCRDFDQIGIANAAWRWRNGNPADVAVRINILIRSFDSAVGYPAFNAAFRALADHGIKDATNEQLASINKIIRRGPLNSNPRTIPECFWQCGNKAEEGSENCHGCNVTKKSNEKERKTFINQVTIDSAWRHLTVAGWSSIAIRFKGETPPSQDQVQRSIDEMEYRRVNGTTWENMDDEALAAVRACLDKCPPASPPNVLTYEERQKGAIEYLAHGCDGPVTVFVVMSRAIELARAGKYLPCQPDGNETSGYRPDPIANALFIFLEMKDSTIIEGNGS